jgi:hypothetical protein
MRGVLSLVVLSFEDEPRSDEVARSGLDGAAGTTDNEPVPLEAENVPESVGARFAPTE